MSELLLGCDWPKRRIRPLSANHSSFSAISDISNKMENIHNAIDGNNDICVSECNGSTVVTLDNDNKDVDEDFEFVYVNGEEKSSIASQNEYIQELVQHTKLEILQQDKGTRVHQRRNLVYLSISYKSIFESLRTWTNTCLEAKGEKSFCIEIFGIHCFGNGKVD
jgi:hypothetical protein